MPKVKKFKTKLLNLPVDGALGKHFRVLAAGKGVTGAPDRDNTAALQEEV